MGVAFPLITFPYASRILGPNGIGKVSFSQSIISYFVMLAMLGVSNYGIREAGKVKNDKEKLSKFVSEVLTLNIVSSFISYILLFCIILSVPFFSTYRGIILVCSISILFTTMGVDWLFYAIEELGAVALRTFIFQLASMVLLFILVRKPDDYIYYALIGVVSSVGSNFFAFFYSRKYIKYTFCRLKDVKKHLKPVFAFFLMSIASTINASLDVSMIGFIVGDEQVGLYSTAMKVVRIVIAVATSATVILPRLSYYHSLNQAEEIKILTTKTLNLNIFFTLPAGIGLSIIAKPVITLISGDLYLNSVTILQILSPIILFIAFSNLLGSHLLMSVGKEKITFITVSIGIACNCIINFFLIKRNGAAGAATATLISEALVAVLQLLYARKYILFKNFAIHFFQCICGCIIMGCFVALVKNLRLPTVSTLLISISGGAFLYTTVLILLRNDFSVRLLRRKK